jgi:hypothetical protein
VFMAQSEVLSCHTPVVTVEKQKPSVQPWGWDLNTEPPKYKANYMKLYTVL